VSQSVNTSKKEKHTMEQQMQQGQTIPAEVAQLATPSRVGTPLKRYRPFSYARMVFAIVLFVFAVFPFLFAFAFARISSTTAIVLGVIALLLVGLGMLLLLARGKRATTLYLCTDGVISLGKGQAEAIRWDQVASIVRQYSAFSSWSYFESADSLVDLVSDEMLSVSNRYYSIRWLDLFRADGTFLRLDLMLPFKYREAARSIEGAITQRLLPQLIAAYDAGDPVAFPIQFGRPDSITVSTQGITLRGETLPWHELKQVAVPFNKPFIEIKKEGKLFSWKTIKVMYMPNVCVFAGLIGQAAGGQKVKA
jgi:hypothetical protein